MVKAETRIRRQFGIQQPPTAEPGPHLYLTADKPDLWYVWVLVFGCSVA